MKWIIYNILSIILIGMAGAMVFFDKPDWGWFLFAGLLLAIGPSLNNNNEEDED